MAKTDIENSFKIIPIHPDDQELLGFAIQGQYFYDKTLLIGLSYSCKLFEALSSAVHQIVDNKLNGCGCVHVLDDFLFVGQGNSPLCGQTLSSFLDLLTDIGLPIKQEKTVLPTTAIIFLGLELGSEKMKIRLPEDKMVKLKDKLAYIANMKKVTLEELHSLIGFLKFAFAVVTPGRAYLRRIIDLAIGLKKKHIIGDVFRKKQDQTLRPGPFLLTALMEKVYF
jgi:hypothetical protein